MPGRGPTAEFPKGFRHRVFSFISMNWRAQPLVSYRVIVDLISVTATTTGLSVRCELAPTRLPDRRQGVRPGDRCDQHSTRCNLLDQARARAADETLEVRFEEGDAEDLPFKAGAFGVVVSMFGAMFAPLPEVVAGELARICRHGGIIALVSWTPAGFIGKLFKVTGRHVPAAAAVPNPLLWGDETIVRQRLGNRVADIGVWRRLASLEFPFSVPDTVEFRRTHYGPTLRAFAELSEANQAALRRNLEDLYIRHNKNSDSTTSIAAEYLEVIATRA